MAVQLTKLTWTQAKLLFECFSKSSVGRIASRKRNFCNVNGPYPQLSSRTFQTYPANVGRNVFTCAVCEYTMKVGDREVNNCRQPFSVERFVNVLADILLNCLDTLAVGLLALGIRQHEFIIVCQNFCSLL